MKITTDEARAFWAHPSQQIMGATPDNLPDAFQYWASGPVCLAFHQMPWPDVWMCHIGAKPEGWGKLDHHVTAILSAFCASGLVSRVVAWIDRDNRLTVALARRVGFVTDGHFNNVKMMGWTPCQ